MFCDQCGTELGSGQNFCRACGKPLSGIPLGPARSRMDGHIKLLGILWLAISGLRLLPGLFLAGVGSHSFHFWNVPHFLLPIIGLIGGMYVVTSILGFVTGWGLLERAPWARPLAIGLGIFALLDPPFGTALGVYTLWALLSDGGAEYARLTRTV
jgi:hypothetical protein